MPVLPNISEEARPYWEGCRRHELLLQRCAQCERVQFYPRSICASCLSDRLDWFRATGRGTIYSFTVVHRPPSPAFAQRVPYVVALVDLEEGVRMMANLVDSSPERARIGMPVEVTFEDVTADMSLPQFMPAR